MSERVDFILGFDPGGQKNFGWSICHFDGTSLLNSIHGRANNAKHAFDVVNARIDELSSKYDGGPKVLAAGIDAPMLWGKHGNREIDEVIRDELRRLPPSARYGNPGVLEVNSLWGAVLVQGVLLGKYLYDKYRLAITETHPKALLRLLEGSNDGSELENLLGAMGNEHERDATVSAFAAMKMHVGATGWRNLYEPSSNLIPPPLGVPASYWMPKW